jgi:hypothetical protein
VIGSHCQSFAIFAFIISGGCGGSGGSFKDLPENVYLGNNGVLYENKIIRE